MTDISKNLYNLRDFKIVSIISFFILILLLFLLISFNLSTRYLIILLALPILTTLLLNFNIIYKIFILSLFYEFGVYYFFLSTLIVPFVVLSFFITFSFKIAEIKNPIMFFFSLFLISIIPSYFAAFKHPESYLISYNLLAFLAILFITPIVFTQIRDLKSMGIMYLIGSSINAIYLIIQAIVTGKRVFGFSDVMYVDLAGIGIIISYLCFLFYDKHKMVFGFITLLQVVALLFTQTRNAWLSTLFIMMVSTVYYIYKKEKFKKFNLFNIKKVLVVVTSILIIIISAELFFPKVFSRISSHRPQTTAELSTSMDFGSIATRFFIWQTAFDVFKDNPIVGTGFHSFRFVSLEYSKLTPFLYNTFVYNLTPHTTILALLADTGLVGFIGFIIFLFFTIRFFKTNLVNSKTRDQSIISFILFWCQIYILVSMIMTDAWLWGVLHMLWAIILGSAVSLNSDIEKMHLFNNPSMIADER